MLDKTIYNKCKLRSKSCDLCQRKKYYTKRTEGKFNIKLPSEPNQQWSVDIFGPLVTSSFGHKYILVIKIINKFTFYRVQFFIYLLTFLPLIWGPFQNLFRKNFTINDNIKIYNN